MVGVSLSILDVVVLRKLFAAECLLAGPGEGRRSPVAVTRGQPERNQAFGRDVHAAAIRINVGQPRLMTGETQRQKTIFVEVGRKAEDSALRGQCCRTYLALGE